MEYLSRTGATEIWTDEATKCGRAETRGAAVSNFTHTSSLHTDTIIAITTRMLLINNGIENSNQVTLWNNQRDLSYISPLSLCGRGGEETVLFLRKIHFTYTIQIKNYSILTKRINMSIRKVSLYWLRNCSFNSRHNLQIMQSNFHFYYMQTYTLSALYCTYILYDK